MDTQTLRRLADRADIIDVVTAFAVALDTRNWDLLRSCLADPVEVDYPDSVGVATFTADDLVATAQRFFGRLDATLHISANHQITIEGDRATCVSSLLAAHFLASAGDEPLQRQVGYYTNHLERLDQWRIRRTEQQQAWTEGNPAVFAYAAGAFA
jgi:SnoaL-like domain